MKRTGRIRDCDARTLSGRPSFTISTFGESLELEGRFTHKTGVHRRAGRETIDRGHAAAAPRPGVHAGPTVEQQTTIATGIYGGQSSALLSHIWPAIKHHKSGELGSASSASNSSLPTIRGSPGKSVQPPRRKRQTLRGAPPMQDYAKIRGKGGRGRRRKKNPNHHPGMKRSTTVDQYSANAPSFRASFSGTGFNTSAAINLDGLTPAMRKQYRQHQSDLHASMQIDVSKPRWNQDPHYRRQPGWMKSQEERSGVRLNDPPKSGRVRGRVKSAKKRLSMMHDETDYTTPDRFVDLLKEDMAKALQDTYGTPQRRKHGGNSSGGQQGGIGEDDLAAIIATIESAQTVEPEGPSGHDHKLAFAFAEEDEEEEEVEEEEGDDGKG